jgi:hypothetical protein
VLFLSTSIAYARSSAELLTRLIREEEKRVGFILKFHQKIVVPEGQSSVLEATHLQSYNTHVSIYHQQQHTTHNEPVQSTGTWPFIFVSGDL